MQQRNSPILYLNPEHPVCLGLCRNVQTKMVMPLFAAHDKKKSRAYAFFYDPLTSEKDETYLLCRREQMEAAAAWESTEEYQAYIDGIGHLLRYKSGMASETLISFEYRPRSSNPPELGTIRMNSLCKHKNVPHINSRRNCIGILLSEIDNVKPLFKIVCNYSLNTSPKRECAIISMKDFHKKVLSATNQEQAM